MRLGMLIDLRTCIGCHACSVACKSEFDVPLGVFRDTVKYVEAGKYPHANRHFLPVLCNHCEAAPCFEACPIGALYAAVPDVLALVSFALAIYPAFLLSWTWSSPASHSAGSALVYLCSGALLGAAAASIIATFVPDVSDPAMDARARMALIRLLCAHVVALGFLMLSLRANETRFVFDELWHGTWSGAFLILVTGVAILLSAPTLAGRSRAAPAITALISAAASRYIIFAAH